MENTHERTGKFIGRLRDLGLGNPKGIPSEYADKSDAQLHEIAQELAEKLEEPTDLTAISCIDGRDRLGNADGSSTEVRLHSAGGTSSNLPTALNAEASVVNTLSPEAPLEEQVETIDDFVADTTGFEPSAHTGGCGKGKEEVKDNETIHEKTEILTATKTLFDIPEVREYLVEGYEGQIDKSESIYDEELAERVRVNAGKTAQVLREGGWSGQKYVEMVTKRNPRGVEEIKADEEDDFHGHKEPFIAIIIGDKTLKTNGFVLNLKVIKEKAEAYAGQRGFEGYKQALIAAGAEEMTVSDRLPSDRTPILLLRG